MIAWLKLDQCARELLREFALCNAGRLKVAQALEHANARRRNQRRVKLYWQLTNGTLCGECDVIANRKLGRIGVRERYASTYARCYRRDALVGCEGVKVGSGEDCIEDVRRGPACGASARTCVGLGPKPVPFIAAAVPTSRPGRW